MYGIIHFKIEIFFTPMGKIILDCDLMKHPNSGLYQYCLNVGNHVDEQLTQMQSKDRIHYYVPPAERLSFENPRNAIVERKYHKFLKSFLWDCDVWHAPFQSGRILPEPGSKVKILLTIHDLNCLHEDKPGCERKNSLAHTQNLIDRADAIVCISDFCKSDVLRHCYVGKKPLYVIHNGTHKLHDPSLSTNSYKPGRPFLFGMGYVNRKKNFHVLLPMVQDADLELVIAGRLDEPDYVGNIMAEAKRKGIEDKVHLLGPVSEHEKSWYLKNCLAYMHPSRAEGFGAPVVEAMSFGKPVFLSKSTSLPEIGGDVSFYFSTFHKEHMHTIFSKGMKEYNKNGLSKRIIAHGRQFDWRHKASEYIEVYRSLMKKK